MSAVAVNSRCAAVPGRSNIHGHENVPAGWVGVDFAFGVVGLTE
jgi:hypothetical protein